MLCVSVSGVCLKMEYLDDDDFMLTQQPSKEFSDTQSFGSGADIVDYEEGVVSLETNGEAKFDLDGDKLLPQSDIETCDGIQIEDISDDEEVDTM